MKTLRRNLFLWLAALVIFAAGYNLASADTITGHAECATTGWPLYEAEVKAFEVDPAFGGSYTVDPNPLATGSTGVNGDFSITFTPPPATGLEKGGADLIFQFTQNINGSIETVYQENSLETHWNVENGDHLVFQITSPLAVCLNPAAPLGSIPNDNLFLFIRIGNCETAETDCRGNDVSSSGYYRPRKAPYNFPLVPSQANDTDQPFGRTLHLFGWFGKLCQVDYYKVQYLPDGGSSWIDIGTNLPNKWYDTSDFNPLNWHWVSESMGPFSTDNLGLSPSGLDNLYRIPYFVRPDTPWSFLDRVALFNTTSVPDGPCRIRIIPYVQSDTTLSIATSAEIEVDAQFGEIVLQLDNSPPTVEIISIKKNGSIQSDCDIIDFSLPTDTIELDFRVWDQNGHLRNYILDAMYGHDCYVSPRPTSPDNAADDYDNNAAGSPSWQGAMSYKCNYESDDYLISPVSPCTPGVMPTCAYQFRLRVWKRATNGYGLIYHAVEDTLHVTIER